MPPKTKRSPSPGGARARSGSRGAAGKAKAKPKAKATAAPEEPDPRAQLLEEAESLFEKHEPEGKLDGVLKLAQFAEIVRGMNSRKCMLWGDDPAPIIKREWTKSGGAAKREIALADFKAWWPEFAEEAAREFEAKAEEEEAREAAAQKAREEKYSGDGIWRVALTDLKEAIAEACKKGKTPLFIDNTPNARVETFFAYYSESHIVDCKMLVVEKAKGSASVEELLEEERRRFWSGKCFKYGAAVVFRLANTACNLKGMFNSETFPSLALLDRSEVAKVAGQDNVGNVPDSPFYKMARDDDEQLELRACGIHEDFRVVVVTQFAEEDYEEFLKDMIPLDLLQPIKPSVD